MTDRTTFEERLAVSLDRYADRMPAIVDAHHVTRSVIGTQSTSGPRWRPSSASAWPLIRIALLLGLVVAVILGSSAFVGGFVHEPRPVPINGPLMLTTHGDPHQLQLVAPDGSGHTTVEVGSPTRCPHLLPGGQKVAYWTVDGALEVVAIGGSARTVLDRTPFRDIPGGSAEDGVWSADGGHVAVLIDGVRIIDTLSGAIRQIPVDDVVASAWAPNGDLTIARQMSGAVQLANIGADDVIGPEIVRYAWDTETMGLPWFTWSPPGTDLVYLVNRSSDNGPDKTFDMVILETQSGSRSTVASGVESSFGPPQIFSPDGRQIAVATKQGLIVKDVDGTTTVTIDPIAAPWALVGWSPDGTWIALSAGDRNVVAHPDGTGLVTLTSRLSSLALGRGGAASQLTWSPDSSMLAFMSEGYGTHSVSTFHVDGTAGRTIADFEAQGGGINCLSWPALVVP